MTYRSQYLVRLALAESFQAAQVIIARRLLQAAIRRLQPLEHPSGYKATHEGPALLKEARQLLAEAAQQLDTMTTRG